MTGVQTGRYVGSTWRSRFLRAPKAALELAGRKDFVPLGELATVRLGLKTGHDKFFYLTRAPQSDDRRELSLLRRRGLIKVTGLSDWAGDISAQDLLPAVLNPHELFTEEGRRFRIPSNTERLYLYPRDAAPRADLAPYIDLGERQGVHRRELVQSNASANRWYRQARGIVTAPWALPYNSAYDYGAWDNTVGAVLNGRFVGAEALAGVDSDLLGAALNSTFAVVGRLLEGMATGVEGALDVGPPAARGIRLPDIRRITGRGASDVIAIVNEMRRIDAMPPAPGSDLTVDPLRKELDITLLRSLGLSRGRASGIIGRTYQSYARWRGAVERVEDMMQEYRRAMSRNGQNRSVSPAELAARRIWEEIEYDMRVIPSGLLTVEDALDTVALPRSIPMPTQDSLFDGGVIHFQKGKPVDLGSYERVCYAGMLGELGFEPPLVIPRDPLRAQAIVDAFVDERRRVESQARTRASAYVSSPDTLTAALSLTDRYWIARCREGGMTPHLPPAT